jgi:hypothetical protein
VTTDRHHGFDMAARGFVAAFDALDFANRKSFADLPAKADVRPVMAQAEWLRDQRPNRRWTSLFGGCALLTWPIVSCAGCQTRAIRRGGPRCLTRARSWATDSVPTLTHALRRVRRPRQWWNFLGL